MADENFSVESLADIFSLSRSSSSAQSHIISGTTPGEYLVLPVECWACHFLLLGRKQTCGSTKWLFEGVYLPHQSFFKAYNMTPTDFPRRARSEKGRPTT